MSARPPKYFRATTIETSMRASRGRQPATRRKWSDWGECSAECVRTRHRLNCDDLLQLEQVHDQQASASLVANKTALQDEAPLVRRLRLQIAGAGGGKSPPARRHSGAGSELEGGQEEGLVVEQAATISSKQQGAQSGELAAGSGGEGPAISGSASGGGGDDELEDYGDEGDELEDTSDSCARVQSARTFEEQSCLGGQCKFNALASAPAPGEPHQRARHRATQQRPSKRPAKGQNGFQTAPGDLNFEQPQQPRRPGEEEQTISSHQQRLHVGNSRPPGSAAWLPAAAAPPAPVHPHGPSVSPLNLDSQAQIELLAAGGHWPPAAKTAGPPLLTRAPNNAGGSPSAAPGAQQQQQHLIQLGLLSGALVTLILFTLLLIRRLLSGRRRFGGPLVKLAPSASYHWMLAKQTKRAPAACCHVLAGDTNGGALLPQLLQLEADEREQTRRAPPHARHAHSDQQRAWPPPPSASKRHFFVDFRGNHFVLDDAKAGAGGSLAHNLRAASRRGHLARGDCDRPGGEEPDYEDAMVMPLGRNDDSQVSRGSRGSRNSQNSSSAASSLSSAQSTTAQLVSSAGQSAGGGNESSFERRQQPPPPPPLDSSQLLLLDSPQTSTASPLSAPPSQPAAHASPPLAQVRPRAPKLASRRPAGSARGHARSGSTASRAACKRAQEGHLYEEIGDLGAR